MNRSSLLKIVLILLSCAGLSAGPAAAQSPQTHQHSFGGAEQWAQIFDDPKRDAWQKPHEVIQALALKPDAVIADIGSGTGYFSARFANMVPKGRVYGVDTEPDMVKYLAERAKREGLYRRSRALLEKTAGLAQARRATCDHRLSHGLAGRSSQERAYHSRPRENRVEGRRLCAHPGARVPAEPVFSDFSTCEALIPAAPDDFNSRVS
ncbi:MAG: methyltransferase domain-containing protein [Betaproteobacteria bacterium]|nr:methyltransferase domain-containing protein [Betaproteobacteria bacterium]